MSNESTDLQRFPIGKFSIPDHISEETVNEWIAVIETFPSKVSALTSSLNQLELQATYRDGSWTIEQLVHHCADSHMNSYIRFKLALTEDNPAIRPYHEDRWAELPDYKTGDISDGLALLDVLHKKWVVVLNNLTSAELNRTFKHPESGDVVSLEENVGIYAWHCEHHLKHIEIALASTERL